MRTSAALLTALCLSLPFVGCNAGTDGGTGGTSDPGSASFVLTDAALDDLDVFEVDVDALRFQKAGGSTVSALPRAVRVDFVELSDVGDLVARVSLEPGFYSSMALDLDFSNATAFLTSQTQAAAILDGDGNPITGTVSVAVDFAPARRPRILPNRHHTVQLDLDLNQAITVDQANNTVTFVPVVSVDFDPTDPKPIVATGFLKSVDQGTGTFELEKRSLDGGTVLTFPVRTSAITGFQVSGIVSLGADGIAALARLPLETTRVFVQGTFSRTQSGIDALGVESGAGVPGNGQDWVTGWVVGRSSGAGTDPELTILGRSFEESTRSRVFNNLHTVRTTAGVTKVLRRGGGNRMGVDDLNIGQLVIAFGELTGTVLDATDPTSVVRMAPTTVYGTAAGPAQGDVLTIDVVRFGPRDVSRFDFDVAGFTEADPRQFTINASAIDTTGIEAGSRICATGWLNPASVAADPNFAPTRIVNRSVEAKLFFVAWAPTAEPGVFDTTAADEILVDVNAAPVKFVYDGFETVGLNATPVPALGPREAIGIYRIVHGEVVSLHWTFDAFMAALRTKLAEAGVRVVRVSALGLCEPSTQAFDANGVTIVLR